MFTKIQLSSDWIQNRGMDFFSSSSVEKKNKLKTRNYFVGLPEKYESVGAKEIPNWPQFPFLFDLKHLHSKLPSELLLLLWWTIPNQECYSWRRQCPNGRHPERQMATKTLKLVSKSFTMQIMKEPGIAWHKSPGNSVWTTFIIITEGRQEGNTGY